MTHKERAIEIMEGLDNTELEELISSMGKDVTVTFLTRGLVEEGVKRELAKRSESEVASFLQRIGY